MANEFIRRVPGINFAYPFKISDGGYYQMNQTSRKAIKDNIINILLTNPGERVILTDFGVGLRSFLFEPINESTKKTIASLINDNLARYYPEVIIKTINILTADDTKSIGDNEMQIRLAFSYTFNESMLEQVVVSVAQ